MISTKAKRNLAALAALWLGLFATLGQTALAADPPPAAPAANEKQPAASAVGPEYRIGPGDVLQVFVWRNPELTISVPVRPDGKISTPLVENMVAVGKTPTQLARDVEKVLAEYVRSPTVNIIVTAPASTLSQVRAIGQVGKPQAVPFREGMTVLDLVLQVGGLGQFASGNRAKIVRQIPGKPGKTEDIRVRLSDLVNKGDMKQNQPLRPGDVLVVPQTLF